MPVPQTVLVVDDDPMVRAMVARILAADGYTVRTASHGAEALVIARALVGRLSLVVTDLDMPLMNGVELAMHLSQLNPPPRVLLISGVTPLAKGPLPPTYLPKPFGFHALATAVHQLLDAPDAGPRS